MGLLGALLLCAALPNCGDNGNEVGIEEPHDGDTAGPGVGEWGGGEETSGVSESDAGSNVAVTGSGGSGVGGSVNATGGGPAETSNGVGGSANATGGGPAETSDSGGTTGTGGAPAETTPCGPEELDLHCEPDEICRGIETLGSEQYSCQPNPCLEHRQSNSCECAASLCVPEAPNCVMLEEDTVLACVCVFC
ncbi:MAG TPA: hypothetical protein VI197_02690 [Polyangiaceae bacterium]